MSEEKDNSLDEKLMKHEYDGIQELDNDLPNWWVALFYITILIAIVYMVKYHVIGDGKIMEQVYAEQTAEIQKRRADALANYEKLPEADKQAFLASKGVSLFAKNCAICHGNNGEGTVGPNLTDNYAIHGYDNAAFEKVIRDGVLAKGMPEWTTKMSDFEIKAVTAYVGSLTGTNVANGKAKQGYDISKGAESYNAEIAAEQKKADEEKARLAAEAEAAKKSGVKVLSPAEKLAAMSPEDQKAFLMKEGKAQYSAKCFACHGPTGGGTIGPNLTDNHLKHGTTKADMEQVVIKGVPGTAMSAWKGQMTDVQIKAVTEYIWSLKGTNVAGGKAPEGTEIK